MKVTWIDVALVMLVLVALAVMILSLAVRLLRSILSLIP